MHQGFVPRELDFSRWEELQPLYQELLDRPIRTKEELIGWLADWSELSKRVGEYGTRCHIDRSCHTEDPEIERRFLHFVENIQPRIRPVFFELQKKFLSAACLEELSEAKYRLLRRNWQADVEIFRPENVPLQTQVTKLNSEYDRICGAMMVNFRGQEYTLQQMARFLEDPDRATRQEAWEAVENRRAQDWLVLDGLFQQLLELRHRIAVNAGCADFREYIWKAYKRFDYTPEDCERLAEAIERHVVPVVRELDAQRARELGLARLRPWDLAVDPKGRPALRPFEANDVDRLIGGVARICRRVAPSLGEQFVGLRKGLELDLDSRKGKRPGGYQAALEVARRPFIFMNAAGLQRDVETLLHEAGHAFHYLAASEEPLVFLRHAPAEFCEVASMSMELLGLEHIDEFYRDGEEVRRARRQHLEGIVRFLPWMAVIDQFQHWLYTHPGHNSAERRAAWLALHGRFSSSLVDWSGYEEERAWLWQRQLHLFHHPFYYVEYGIAQLGALKVWQRWRDQPEKALGDLQRAFRLGGTRPLPELFRAAGIPFDFSERTLVPLIEGIRRELEELPW